MKFKELVNSSKFKRGIEISFRICGVILLIQLIAYIFGVEEMSKLEICLSQFFVIWVALFSKVTWNIE